MNKKNIYETALYLRLSRDDADIDGSHKTESNSISGQRDLLRAYVKNHEDLRIFDVYVDDGFSGTSSHERPEFQRMISDSTKRLFDVVIVWKLDSFARNRYDSAHNKAILRKNGVKVISAKENISDGPEGIILESMLYLID